MFKQKPSSVAKIDGNVIYFGKRFVLTHEVIELEDVATAVGNRVFPKGAIAYFDDYTLLSLNYDKFVEHFMTPYEHLSLSGVIYANGNIDFTLLDWEGRALIFSNSDDAIRVMQCVAKKASRVRITFREDKAYRLAREKGRMKEREIVRSLSRNHRKDHFGISKLKGIFK